MHLARGSLQALALGHLVFMLGHALLIAALAFFGIVRVRPGVKFTGGVVDLDDAVTALIQKIAVMRDGHDRARIGLQVIAQPAHCVQVQVVGRLVEQQDIGLLQDDARQVDAGFFAA